MSGKGFDVCVGNTGCLFVELSLCLESAELLGGCMLCGRGLESWSVAMLWE